MICCTKRFSKRPAIPTSRVKSGRFAASSDATGAIKPRALGLLNISSIYLLLSKFHPMLSRGARVKACKLSANKVRIIVTPEDGVTEKPYQCENRLGIFESLATLFTAKYATVVHDRCVHRGDADCCYEVSWEEPPHRRWERFLLTGLIALAIFMAVGPWLFALSGWLFGLVVGLAGLLCISTYTNHLEKLDLTRTILSYPDLLLMDIEVGSPLIDPLNKIRSAGLRATVIVQDLLALARLGLPLSEVIDFNDIVGLFMKSPELESLQVHHPKVKIFADLEENLTAIKGSTVHLLKSLMNIVNNAAEAMPDGGDVRIVTRHLEVASDDPRQQQNRQRGATWSYRSSTMAPALPRKTWVEFSSHFLRRK